VHVDCPSLLSSFNPRRDALTNFSENTQYQNSLKSIQQFCIACTDPDGWPPRLGTIGGSVMGVRDSTGEPMVFITNSIALEQTDTTKLQNL
jgi:hypothetical protein